MRDHNRVAAGAGFAAVWHLLVLALALLVGPAGVEGAVFIGTIKQPVSWAYLAKFCFLPAKREGGSKHVQGMIRTAIKFKANSHFSLLHYTTGESHVRDSDDVLKSWEDTYNSPTSCNDRVKNPLAFPFYLADLARAVPRPPDLSTGRSLLQAAPAANNSSNQVTFVLNGQTVTIDLDMAGSLNQGGLGLVDVTASNARDGLTQSALDSAAKIRFHPHGYVEIIRTTFYVGDRSRFFFIAGANCNRLCADENCDGSIDIEYDITFTNGYKWHNKHFSADEIGVVETMWTFSILQVLLCAFFWYVRWQLKKVHKYHHTVKMLGASIALALLAHLCFVGHYFRFAFDGIGVPDLIFLGRLWQGASETVFLLLLIMLAKGWTICCRKISARGRVKIAVFGTVYGCVSISVPVGYYYYSDRASTLHIYQSMWGYLLAALRGFGMGWFWYSSYVTYYKYHAKVAFYRKFVFAFTLWFVGLPITIGIAFALDPWVRFLFVNAIDYTFLFLFQLVLLMMYNPSTIFNKSFPFHATTLDALATNKPKILLRRTQSGGALAGAFDQDDTSGAGNHGGPSAEVSLSTAGAQTLGGNTPVKSFGNTAFQKNILSSAWDQKDFQQAIRHARTMVKEGELLMHFMETIEASHEDEDEAYDMPPHQYGASPLSPTAPKSRVPRSGMFGAGGMVGGMSASLRMRMAGGGAGAGDRGGIPGSSPGSNGFQAPTRVFNNNGQPQPVSSPPPSQQPRQNFGSGGKGASADQALSDSAFNAGMGMGGNPDPFGDGGGLMDEEGGLGGSQSLGGNQSLMARMGGKSKGRGVGGYT
mmetsp:Transcript_28997/g.72543  ORF Transcript_28997/g.72543 Transcript_28997/m.72543 type:complete len:815 (-) Transcript_28997:282-2726(-)